MNSLSKELIYKQLIEIFKAVADACDGGQRVTKDIRRAYEEAMTAPEIEALYKQLVDERRKAFFANT